MAKLKLDKYYTPVEVANKCWDIVDKTIGLNNIKTIIEPSVGNGSFCQYTRKPDIMIDLEPEIEGAIKSDYIDWCKTQQYQKGTLVIGNPPFGERNHLSQMFMKYSCKIADYIAFILPVNQLNNSYSFAKYGFDLIESIDLGEAEYSGVKLNCCFNIYKRPEKGLNKVDKVKSKDIKIVRHDQKVEIKSNDIKIQNCVAGGKKLAFYNELQNYDVRFVYWGSGCAGKILNKDDKRYAGEYKIYISDENKDKQAIIDFIKSYDWNGSCKSISMKRISKQDILNELNKRFNINQAQNDFEVN